MTDPRCCGASPDVSKGFVPKKGAEGV